MPVSRHSKQDGRCNICDLQKWVQYREQRGRVNDRVWVPLGLKQQQPMQQRRQRARPEIVRVHGIARRAQGRTCDT